MSEASLHRQVALHMTVPPSVNSNWRAVNGRVIKSKKYREWMADLPLRYTAADRLTAFPVSRAAVTLTGDLAVHIEMRRPRKNSDLDNRIKPILDKLAAYGFIENDKQVVSISARWREEDGCDVLVGQAVPA